MVVWPVGLIVRSRRTPTSVRAKGKSAVSGSRGRRAAARLARARDRLGCGQKGGVLQGVQVLRLLQQPGLVAFDLKPIVAAFFHDGPGQATLTRQWIGGDALAVPGPAAWPAAPAR